MRPEKFGRTIEPVRHAKDETISYPRIFEPVTAMSADHLRDLKATPGRVALVTAGSAGLGAQIARALAPDFRVVSQQ